MFCVSKNHLLTLTGGFLLGLFIGWLIWNVELEMSFKPDLARDSGQEQSSELHLVRTITDGDSIVLASGAEVRLLGVDSTEYGDDCYVEAREFLSSLIANKEVRLTMGKEDKDKYGRLLRWLWLDAENINLQLVEAGFAKAYIYGEQLEYEDALIDAEAQARDELRGCLWQDYGLIADLPTIDYTLAPEHIGEEVLVSGQIDNIFQSAAGNIFINFCPDYKSCEFSAVVFKSDQHRFEELPNNGWSGQQVEISGQIEEYEGRAEIIVADPRQIKLNND